MTNPIYDPSQPPNPQSKIGQAQTPFLMNFMALYNAFAENHVALDSATDAGNHTIIELLSQTGQFQTDAGQISCYAKNVGTFSEGEINQPEQLFLRYQGNTPEFQWTNYQIYPLQSTSTQTPFFTFLPGGIFVYFGLISVNLSNTASIPMKLFPSICRNIMTINFCPVGTSPSFPPRVNLQQPDNNGIYNTINLFGSVPSIVQPSQLFYFIAGNV